jgi:hypothetical protein
MPVVTRVAVAAALAWCALVGPVVPAGSADLEAAACSPAVEGGISDAEGLVPVESLAQGNVFDHGPPRSILLVSTRPDLIVAVIDPAEASAIGSVDLSTHVLVALFVGRWPQEGHRVTVESVRATETGICLTARMTGPSPGQDAADAETYPYHVVAVPRAALPEAPGTIWTAVSTDGAVVATTTFP